MTLVLSDGPKVNVASFNLTQSRKMDTFIQQGLYDYLSDIVNIITISPKYISGTAAGGRMVSKYTIN